MRAGGDGGGSGGGGGGGGGGALLLDAIERASGGDDQPSPSPVTLVMAGIAVRVAACSVSGAASGSEAGVAATSINAAACGTVAGAPYDVATLGNILDASSRAAAARSAASSSRARCIGRSSTAGVRKPPRRSPNSFVNEWVTRGAGGTRSCGLGLACRASRSCLRSSCGSCRPS